MNSSDQPITALSDAPVLNFEDAVRFFQNITPDGKCFACGTDKWEIPFFGAGLQRCVLIPTGMSQGGKSTYSLNLVCTHCGLSRTHDVGTILSWVEKNPAEKPGGVEQ
ncbi:hypothetical protein [Pseudomonas batumici]|uniref:hypothetical protein n=1 Tax=Pseudomonas batumici TaxID=226910 RepID=UPI0012ECC340|nr:hypothetical protein [Pseudomonas batumici]